jgi:hypothetical protein
VASEIFKATRLQCESCLADEAKLSLTVWDAKFDGQVCQECGRVYVEGHNPKNFHYVDEKHMRRKIMLDRKRRGHGNPVTKMIADRWLKEFST